MSPSLAEPPLRTMAKKKATPTASVRVAVDVAELAAIVAAYRRKPTPDLLTEILRPILHEMHAEEIRRTAGRPPQSPKKGGGK